MDRYRAHNWHCFGDIDARAAVRRRSTPASAARTGAASAASTRPSGSPSYRDLAARHGARARSTSSPSTYGVVNLKFVDEMFVLNRRHVLGICDRLAAARLPRQHLGLRARRHGRGRVPRPPESGGRQLALPRHRERERPRARRRRASATATTTSSTSCAASRAPASTSSATTSSACPTTRPRRMQETLDLALELNCEFANFYSAMAYPGLAALRRGRARRPARCPPPGTTTRSTASRRTPLGEPPARERRREILALPRRRVARATSPARGTSSMVERTFGAGGARLTSGA